MNLAHLAKTVASEMSQDGLLIPDYYENVLENGTEDNSDLKHLIKEAALKYIEDEEELEYFLLFDGWRLVHNWIMHEVGRALSFHPFSPDDYDWEQDAEGGEL